VYLLQRLEKEDPISLQDEEMKYLYGNGYLNTSGELIRSKVIEEFYGTADQAEWFYELFDLYPQKVTDKYGGIRILRPATYNNKSVKSLMDKYLSSVKTLERHKYVIKCLNNEIASRQKSDSSGFFQALDTYINQQSWDKYANEDVHSSVRKGWA
jgi:hypothetical protein